MPATHWSAVRRVRLATAAKIAKNAPFVSSAALANSAATIAAYGRSTYTTLDASSKEFNLSSSNTRRWASIVEQLRECVLRCRNCHQEVHSGMVSQPALRAPPPGRRRGMRSSGVGSGCDEAWRDHEVVALACQIDRKVDVLSEEITFSGQLLRGGTDAGEIVVAVAVAFG
jgi:hypothetical protein